MSFNSGSHYSILHLCYYTNTNFYICSCRTVFWVRYAFRGYL